jgi:tetratricopeptide (TPR) repeat protein
VLESIADPAQPGGLEAANTLGVVLTQQGRPDHARRLFEAVLARSPHAATTWSNLGLLELSARRSSEAARAFEQAVAADPALAQAWEGLGAARAPFDPAGAIDAWKRAVELAPHNYDVMFNLAVLLRDHARTAEARPYIERFVREAPPQRYTRDIAMFRRWLAEK